MAILYHIGYKLYKPYSIRTLLGIFLARIGISTKIPDNATPVDVYNYLTKNEYGK